MDLHCPKCNSTDLKKVSLAYQEGLFRTDARTRLSAVFVGSAGPDLMVGRATTRAFHQSALSKRLSPPAKWSYLKVGSWSVLAFLCVGWIVFYVNIVTTHTTTGVSAPVALFGLIAGGTFVLLQYFVWKRNHSTYLQQYAEWDRSFICQACGAIASQQ
jgi:hypothetical protein